MSDDIELLKQEIKNLYECLDIQQRVNRIVDDMWSGQLKINDLLKERLQALEDKKND